MSSKKDIVIIGAGVIGCSIAYHLAKKGITSTIIDREAIGARASGKAWGVVAYPPVFLVAEQIPGSFYKLPEGETFADWLNLFWSGYNRMADIGMDIKERSGIDIDYGETPSTYLLTSDQPEAAFGEGLLEMFKEVGAYECEWIGSEELREIFPHVNPRAVGGICRPDLQVEPYKYTLGLGQTAENMGAEIRHGDVVGFGTEGSRIKSIKLASGKTIEADIVVIAMGPWSVQSTSWLGKMVPAHVVMEECLRVKAPAGFPLHSIAHGPRTIVSRLTGDLILAGGDDASWFFKTRDDFEYILSDDLKNQIMQGAINVSSDLEDSELIEHRGDLLAFSPGPNYHKPVLGRLPEWDNGYIATRFGGLGIMLSPGVGQVMADLIADGEVPYRAKHMMEHLSPGRV